MRVRVPAQAFATYEGFAHLYDAFTADHNHDAWIGSIERLAVRHGLRGRRVLDVACGTGKSLCPWLERGYEVTGCDLSPRMLGLARRKVAGRARLFRADMRELPAGAPVDLVTCVCDALNYLLEPDDLRLAFAAAVGRLSRGGIYACDLNTLRGFQDFAGTRRFASGAWDFVWRGRAIDANTYRATITARRLSDETGGDIRSAHVQRHYPIPIVAEALLAAGLGRISVYGVHRDGSIDDYLDEQLHTKALVMALRH